MRFSISVNQFANGLENTTLETERNYISGFFYETDHLTGDSRELLHFAHEEGRVLKQGHVYRYEYNLTDHLGNVRVSFADVDEDGSIDETMEVLTSQSFYPFGLRHGGTFAQSGVANRYRYNGKELQDELGLGWYDYGARMYDPSVARWNGVDALASQYDAWSPYNYVYNNPANGIDPDGRSGVVEKDDENATLTVRSHLYFYQERGQGRKGKRQWKAAQKDVAAALGEINSLWNATNGVVEIDGKEYKVKFEVTGELVSEKEAYELTQTNGDNHLNNFIRLHGGSYGSDRSQMDRQSNAGQWFGTRISSGNKGDDLGRSTTAAHEMGHAWGIGSALDFLGYDDYGHFNYDTEAGLRPNIMVQRGAVTTNPEYGYPNGKRTNVFGQTVYSVNSYTRTVQSVNIQALKLEQLQFDRSGTANIGKVTNRYYSN